MSTIKIEEYYQFYLEKVKLKEAAMSNVQRVETKRAFMAGMSQMLNMLTKEISAVNEAEGVEIINNLFNQLSQFWSK